MDNIVTLTDQFGFDVQFELLDKVSFDGEDFVILLPVDAVSGDELVILQCEEVDEDTESFISVKNEEILQAVFRAFKDKWRGQYEFKDE